MAGLADLLHLPYTPDLTESGLAYICRSLALSWPGKGEPSIPRLQRSLAGVAVELAFRRYLQSQSIRFSVASATPFTDPDHYDVALDGHRCELVNYFISHEAQVSALRRDLSLLLQAPALIPSDDFAAEHHRPDDILLFTFLLGYEAGSAPGISPACWLHLFPKAWSRPVRWHSLKGLFLKTEAPGPLMVELGGLNAGREFLTARVEVLPQKSLPLGVDFYSLAYVRTFESPHARLALHLTGREDSYIISPASWNNVTLRSY